MTKADAQNAVERALRGLGLTKPLTENEMTVFCEEMSQQLEFESVDREQDIRAWAARWQLLRYRSIGSG
jgi:hypothetical protein